MSTPASSPLLQLRPEEQQSAWTLLRRVAGHLGAAAPDEELEGLAPRNGYPMDVHQQMYLGALCAAYLAGAQDTPDPALQGQVRALLGRLTE